MMDPVWFDLGEDAGVLEFPEDTDGRALELYVVYQDNGAGVIAWWESDEGTLLGAAHVGTC